MYLSTILFQFFLQHLIAFDFFMTCKNFKHSISNSEYENWTWGQWELKTVWTTRWKSANHGTVCLGIKQLPVLSCGQTTLIFQSMKKRRRNIVQKEGLGTLKDWEQSQFSALIFHFTPQKLHAKHQSATWEPSDWKNPDKYLLHSEQIPSPLGRWVTGNGNDHLQWSGTPWVTATILFWGAADVKGSVPSERIYSLLTSLAP